MLTLQCRVQLKKLLLWSVMAVAVTLWYGGQQEVLGQFEVKNMEVGSLAHQYSEIGQEPYPSGGYDFVWPSYMSATNSWQIQTQWYAGMWVAVKDFKDEDGESWPVKIAHVGPRATGANEFFPTRFETISKFEPPQVRVDGVPSFHYVVDNDKVDPDLPSDRKIVSEGNTVTGISFKREIYAWGQESHDNYHINVYTFTNTGNTDGDEEIELDNQTAKDVYISRHRRPQGHRMIQVEGQSFDYTGTPKASDIRAIIQFPWEPDGSSFTLGTPLVEATWGWPEADTLGRLSQTSFAGTATLFASKSTSEPSVNDMRQPTTTLFTGCDNEVMAIGQEATNLNKMRQEYEQLSKGHEQPDHAEAVDPDGDLTTKGGDPMSYAAEGFDQGGYCSDWAYGPYTLKPDESVTIVMAEAVDGLNPQEASVIGRAFKEGGEDVEAPITFQGKTLGKNDWWYTGRDSLMQTFEKAQMHYYEGLGSIPEAPMPPQTFEVTSGVDKIQLQWTAYEKATPEKWEVYRTRSLVAGRPRDNYAYDLVATLGPGETSYTDVDVARGIDYYYYIQAVGKAEDNDGSLMTQEGALRSSRYYSQTWDAAVLKRPPGEVTSSARIVPNPYNISSAEGVRWPGQRDKLAFLDIPGQCTIRIYTESGELIKTIEHTDGSGDETWDLTTEDRQIIVSGIYIALIENQNPGPDEQPTVYKKFSVIR